MRISERELFISRIPGVSTRERLLITDTFSTLPEVAGLGSGDLEHLLQRNFSYNSGMLLEEVGKILDDIEGSDIEFVFCRDSEYPTILREIFDPPYLLYKRGGVIDVNLPAVAVVGTRKATEKGLTAAYNIGFEISSLNIYLVSGLASGIDGAVHRGAAAGHGHIIAVLGNGIDYIYPYEHKELGLEIIDQGGTVLSEYPPGPPPLKYNFPERNRILSGLSRAVLVVEAPLQSGALITADFALDQGREVFVHRCSLDSEKGEGCRNLIMEGAGIVDSADDFINYREAV